MCTRSPQAKSSILLAAVFAIGLGWSSVEAGDKNEPVIETAFADMDNGSLYVTGSGMDLRRLHIRIAGFDPLMVVSNSDSHIEAMLPTGIHPGDYLLTFNRKGKPERQQGIPYGLTIGAVGAQGEKGVKGVQGIPGVLALEGQICPYKLLGFDASGKILCAPPPGYWDVTHERTHEDYEADGSFANVADIEACAATCENESLGCKGFSWYEQGDSGGSKCKLLPNDPPVDGSGRFPTPTRTIYHYVSSTAWNSAYCGHLENIEANAQEAFRLAASGTLASNFPSVLETARRLAPDYSEGEPVDLAWLYAIQCRTIEGWELAVSLASTPLRRERAVFEMAKVGGDNDSYLEYVAAYPNGQFADEIDDLRWEYAKKIHLPRHYYSEYNGKCAGTPCKYRDLAKKTGDEFLYTVQAKVASVKVISAPGVWYSPDCLIASLDAGADECGSLEIFHNLAFGLNADINEQLNSGKPNEFNRLLGTFYSPIDIGSGVRYLGLGEGEKAEPYGFIATTTAQATSYQNLKFGGFMFEVNSTPYICRYGTDIHPDLGEVWSEWCFPDVGDSFLAGHYFYSDIQQNTGWTDLDGGKNNGIWSKHWKGGSRDLINGVANTRDSFAWDTIKPIDIPVNRIMENGEWEFPPTERKMTVNFAAGERIEITWEFIRSTETLYDAYLTRKGFKCDGPANPVDWPRDPVEEYGPGFHIVNLTDYPLDISLGQVGPLYYDLVDPGQAMDRNTGAVWFTIKASVNLNGVPKDNTWTAVVPVAKFTAEVLYSALSGGTGTFASGAAKAAIQAAIKEGTKKAGWTAFKYGTKYVSLNAAKSTLTSFATILAEEAYRPEHLYVSDAGEFAGPAWPFRDTPESYLIEGGPRAPCVDAEGNVVFRPSEPMTIREYYP